MGTETEKHTPGPWRVTDAGAEDYNLQAEVAVIDGEHSTSASVIAPKGFKASRGTMFANAKLIAAAPDLLAALQSLMREMSWVNEQLDLMPDDLAEAQNKARAAIAKATTPARPLGPTEQGEKMNRASAQLLAHQHGQHMAALKTAKRKTVTVEQLRAIMGFDGMGLDHAKIAQAMGASIMVDGVAYTVREEAAK